MNAGPSSLEAHVGYWLRFVSNHVSHAFGVKLQSHGLSIAEWVVLREVYEGEIPPSDLARRIGMTRGAVSKIVDKLVAKSLMARTGDKVDRRFQTLSLTAQGLALTPDLAALADRNDEEFFGHLDAATRGAIVKAMREVARRRGLAALPID